MKDKTQTYLDASDEAVRASKRLLAAGLYAPAAYHAFHAFESAGNAFSLSHGGVVKRNHEANRGEFKKHYEKAGLLHQLAPVQDQAYALRNTSRYPRRNERGERQAPSQQIDRETAQEVLRRVRGVLSTIKQNL